MTEDDNGETGRKQTLYQKYDITDNQLSFEFVRECDNPRLLEKILEVLRSREEGHFEKLEEAVEARLRELAPNSRTLLTPEPVRSLSELNPELQNQLKRDYLNWPSYENTASLEDLRREAEEVPRNYPAIRNSGKTAISNNEPQVKGEKPVKSCAPRPFEYWNKFNVEREVALIDREEELKNNAAIRADNERKNQHDEWEGAVGLGETGAGDGHRQLFANSERQKGNEFFKERNFKEALVYYDKSIEWSPTAEAYNNRAMCYIKLRRYEDALKDCSKVLELRPNDKALSKALFRRSTALKELHHYHEAYAAILKALKIDPNDKEIQERANSLKDLLPSGPVYKPSVRMAIKDQDGRRSKPLIEEISSQNIYYPFTSAPLTMAQSDIGTARQMCGCSGVPPFLAKLREQTCGGSPKNLPNSYRLCVRKTRSKKSYNEKSVSNRRKKTSGFMNGEIIEKDTIEDVEKNLFNEEYNRNNPIESSDLLSRLATGDVPLILQAILCLNPRELSQVLHGIQNSCALELCVKALCIHLEETSRWKIVQSYLVALSQLPIFRSSVRTLSKETKDALSERIASVEELGQRVSDIVTLYELNGALPPPS